MWIQTKVNQLIFFLTVFLFVLIQYLSKITFEAVATNFEKQ